jgi:hypothetical protein
LIFMLTFTLLLLGQCPGGSCLLPAAQIYSYRPTGPVYAPTYLYSVPPAYTPTYAAPVVRPAPVYAPPPTYIQPNPPVVVATPAPPQVHSLSDGHGLTWSHANSKYLEGFVAGRKSALDSAAARVTMVRTTASRVPQAPVPPQAPPLEPTP